MGTYITLGIKKFDVAWGKIIILSLLMIFFKIMIISMWIIIMPRMLSKENLRILLQYKK